MKKDNKIYLELKNYKHLIPESEYLDIRLVTAICENLIEQVNHFLTNNDDLENFEFEIYHGYYGGMLFMSNLELKENLELIQKSEEVYGELNIKNINDIYQAIADGVYLEAQEIAGIFANRLIDKIKG